MQRSSLFNVVKIFAINFANLVTKECISQEEALEASNDVNELEKIFRGVYQGTRSYYE